MNRPTLLLALALLSPVLSAPVPTATPILVTLPNDADSVLLGVWDGRRWLNTPGAAAQVRAGTAYRAQGLSGPARRVSGSAPQSQGAPCPDFLTLTLKPESTAAQTQLAVRADLNARPRPLTLLPLQHSLYEGVVRAELQRRGLRNPVVQLARVLRADLDGDGRDEVLIEATHFAQNAPGETQPPVDARVGDYSLLLLRWVKNGQAQTTALAADVVLKPGSTDAPRNGLRWVLEGVADLNGDGRMEMVASESYYEGTSLAAFTWTPAQGPRKVLETGCGS